MNRIAINDVKLVYITCANKQVRYKNGSSPIVYIGTTETGINRVAQSAAGRSDDILSKQGITSFDVRIVTCPVRQRIKTWRRLERAFLLAFKDQYGEVPLCNNHGKKMKETTEFDLFSRKRVMSVLDSLAKTGAPRGRPISS